MSDDKVASMKIARIVQRLVRDKRTHPAAPEGQAADGVPWAVAAEAENGP